MMLRLVQRLQEHLEGAPLRIPEADRLAFSWFADLAATRTYHAASPNPISYAEIEAYGRLKRWAFEPRHAELIRALDDAWLKHAAQSAGAHPHTPGKTEMTPDLFDAVFR